MHHEGYLLHATCCSRRSIPEARSEKRLRLIASRLRSPHIEGTVRQSRGRPMSIKEKPLIKAVERLGPLPGFFFAHPTIAGFFAMIMCPFFGVFVMMFWGLFGTADQMYEAGADQRLHFNRLRRHDLHRYLFQCVSRSGRNKNPPPIRSRRRYRIGGDISV